MLMFEKISALESELESKEMALGDTTSKYTVADKTVKLLSDRVKEVTTLLFRLNYFSFLVGDIEFPRNYYVSDQTITTAQ